jgi:hypothetical protein
LCICRPKRERPARANHNSGCSRDNGRGTTRPPFGDVKSIIPISPCLPTAVAVRSAGVRASQLSTSMTGGGVITTTRGRLSVCWQARAPLRVQEELRNSRARAARRPLPEGIRMCKSSRQL